MDNYILHEKNDLKTTHIAVGRAYYDVKNDQILFSRNAKIDGNLGPLLGDHVYFYNQEQATIRPQKEYYPWFAGLALLLSFYWLAGYANWFPRVNPFSPTSTTFF